MISFSASSLFTPFHSTSAASLLPPSHLPLFIFLISLLPYSFISSLPPTSLFLPLISLLPYSFISSLPPTSLFLPLIHYFLPPLLLLFLFLLLYLHLLLLFPRPRKMNSFSSEGICSCCQKIVLFKRATNTPNWTCPFPPLWL